MSNEKPHMAIDELKRNFRVTKLEVLDGYLLGFRQRLVRFDAFADPTSKDTQVAQKVYEALGPHLPNNHEIETDDPMLSEVGGIASLKILTKLMVNLQLAAGDAVVEKAVVLVGGRTKSGYIGVRGFLPTLVPNLGLTAAKWVLGYYSQCMQKEQNEWEESVIAQEVEDALERCERFAFPGFNTRAFLSTAAKLGIPHVALPSAAFQFGYGTGAKIFRSGGSLETSVIGTIWSANKADTTKLLRLAGFPVADQAIVSDALDAKIKAENFGYPVVLKPCDTENGKGVFPNIKDASDLERCYRLAQEYSRKIIVEKHIPGDTFRLEIVAGKVMETWIRVFPLVVGNGKQTIEELVIDFNRHEDRSHPRFTELKKIEVNDELVYHLGCLGWLLTSVAPEGEVIPLSRSSNWSQGGDVVRYRDEVHPDNIELCEKVAALMGLDIAGIDLVIEQMHLSWRETRCSICDVNAMPQLDEPVLEQYCHHRAPVVVTICSQTVSRSNTRFLPQVLDRSNEVVSVKLCIADLFENGFPLAFVDVAVISDDLTNPRELSMVLQAAAKHGANKIFLLESHPLAADLKQNSDQNLVEFLRDQGDLNDRISSLKTVSYKE